MSNSKLDIKIPGCIQNNDDWYLIEFNTISLLYQSMHDKNNHLSHHIYHDKILSEIYILSKLQYTVKPELAVTSIKQPTCL